MSLVWPKRKQICFLIFWKLVSKWAGSGNVYCECYYSSVVAILSDGVDWFWISGHIYVIPNFSEVRSKADFAAESALLFPITTMWLGIQHIIISLLFDIESSLFSTKIIRGLLIPFRVILLVKYLFNHFLRIVDSYLKSYCPVQIDHIKYKYLINRITDFEF